MNCAKKVWETNAWRPRQCQRAAVEGGYCKQHGPAAAAARRRKMDDRVRRDMAAIDHRVKKTQALQDLVSACRLSRDVLPVGVTAALEAYEALGL